MPGPIDSLKELGRTALDIVHTRVDLLSTELAEEQGRVAELVLYGATAFFCLLLAVAVVAVSVIASMWDGPYRVMTVGVIATILMATGLGMSAAFISKAKAKPRPFASSVEALGADAAFLK